MLKLSPGQIFQQRYRIEQELGAGGMGIVYRATQLDVSRQVALKLLRIERVGQESEFKRFLREFQVLSKIEHANVVLFYSHGITPGGVPYAVCEYVKGRSLQQLLNDKAKLEWRRAAKIAMQIARGMEAVHAAGIVHRDLKPGNIMLCDMPEPDWVKIIDFGLARVEDQSALDKLTQSGLLIGSVNYMSPEQCKAKPADKSSDIYALGCIMFEMLSGEKLFDQSNAVAILHLHCNADLSERFELLRKVAPPEIESLLRRMLAKSGADRPASMQEIEEYLALLLQDQTATTAQLNPMVQTPKRALPLLYSGLAIVCTLTVVFYFAYSKSLRTQKLSESDKAIEIAPKSEIRIRRNFEAMRIETVKMYPTREDMDKRKKVYQLWFKKYGKDPRLTPSELASAYAELLRHQDANEAATTLNECMSLTNKLSFKDVKDRNLAASFLFAVAFYYRQQGNSKQCHDYVARLYRGYQGVELQKNDQAVGLCISALSALGEYDSALKMAKRFIAERDSSPNNQMHAGALCICRKQPQEALKYYKEAFNLLQQLIATRGRSLTVAGLANTGIREGLVESDIIVGPNGPVALPGQRQSMQPTFFTDLRLLAERVLLLDNSMAKQVVRKAIAEAIAHPHEDFAYNLYSLEQLESLASQLGLDERHLCARKIIPLLKKRIETTKDQDLKFELEANLSYRLYLQGMESEALNNLHKASAAYAASPGFKEMWMIRHNIDVAKECVAAGGTHKAEAEKIFQESLELVKKHNNEMDIPAEVDAAIGVYYASNKKQAEAEASFERAMKKCLHRGSDYDDLGSTFDYFLLARRFEQCKRLLQIKERWQDANRLCRLAEQELSSGLKEAAKKDFQLAYSQFFDGRNNLEFPNDEVRCMAGVIASSR